MNADKGALGCFLLVIVLGLLVAGLFLVVDRAQSWATERERAQAQIERERTAQLQATYDHKETMFQMWTVALAAFSNSFGLLDVIGLLAIAALALLGGFGLAHWWGKPVSYD